MIRLSTLFLLTTLVGTTVTAAAVGGSNASVGGYVLINGPLGLSKMSLLASQSPLPISRLYIGFVNPTMSYLPQSKTLNNTGLNLTAGVPGPKGDYGFAALAASIAALRKQNVEVVLSLGGWDFTCFPFLYARYSVAGYGTNTPNYYKITENCGGDINNAAPSNEYCYVCEPTYANESLGDFAIFPEPTWSPTWQAAVTYVTKNAGDPSNPPQWDPTIVPGNPWTDPLTGITTMVPGLPSYRLIKRDPYQDFVHLAVDLGVDGIDIDYEEVWHADYHKTGPAGGPWQNVQTVYKLAAIYADVQNAIDSFGSHLFMTTAGSAAGAWSGNWWGGNLKGTSLQLAQWYPSIASRILWNVMTYDLSDNEEYYECPEPGVCALNQQVNFYMQTYSQGGSALSYTSPGYEIGTPAYPDPEHDPSHDLPLTQSELSLILQNTQNSYSHAFFWEIFKQPPANSGELTPTQLAQQLCVAILGKSTPRCTGTLPVLSADLSQPSAEVPVVVSSSSSTSSSSSSSSLVGSAAILDYLHARNEALHLRNPQPIKSIYIDWRDVNWNAPNTSVVEIVDAGFNVIILAFYLSTTGAVDMLQAWAALDPTVRNLTVAYAHSKGAVIMLSAGGATDIPYTHTNGTAFGTAAGQFALEMGLDGVDIDAENIAPEFTYPPLSGTELVAWLVDASVAVKKVMGSKGIVSHAPQAPYFGPIGGTGWPGSTGGYTGVWTNSVQQGNAITFFNLQFYNQGNCYLNYSSLFVASAPGGSGNQECEFPGTALQEIVAYDIPMTAIVIGKPLLSNDAGSGYVDPTDLHTFFTEAKTNNGWSTGVMAWSWETTQAPEWISTVWPS